MPVVRLGLVANRSAGAIDRVADVERVLRDAGADVEAVALDEFCAGPGRVDEPRLAATARRVANVERVVVAGGDGSLGPAALLALRAARPLAVVPVGTANSFARWFGVPLDVEEAARLAARRDAGTRPIELAEAGGRPFVNVASTGLAVLAARHARPAKRRLGPFAYVLGGVRAALTGRPVGATVSCDGREVWRGEAWQILVAASGAFAGESSTGGVDPEDHRLDVAIVEAGRRVDLVRYGWAMRRGRLVHERGVRHVRGGEVVLALAGRARHEFNVDGEVLALAEARFSVLGRLQAIYLP
jgi:diacylglycerol kinase family enzyme